MKTNARRFLFSITMLVVLVACTKKEKRPASVLSKEELTTLLVDIYLAEARLGNMPITNDSSYKLYMPFEEALLKKKGIPDSVVRGSHRYYLAHPQELEEVYDSVIDSLSLREQKASRTAPK